MSCSGRGPPRSSWTCGPSGAVRAELLARTAPLGPQVHDDRGGPRPEHDIGVEGLFGYLEHERRRLAGVGAVGARVGGAGRLLLPALRGGLPRAEVDGTVHGEVPRRLHVSILPHRST